jgi:hypothetical protein
VSQQQLISTGERLNNWLGLGKEPAKYGEAPELVSVPNMQYGNWTSESSFEARFNNIN